MFLDATEFIAVLEDIYLMVDRAYAEVAEKWGLSCEGCEDNCCQYVFLHHTLVEHIYLLEGLRELPQQSRQQVIKKAEQYNERYQKVSMAEKNFRMFCPLNFDGRCILYRYRPIACRVYGVPAQMQTPRGQCIHIAGCFRIQKLKEQGRQGPVLDRTVFYTRLAELEQRLRRKLCYFQKYKKTIAQMIIDEKAEYALLTRGYDIFEGY